MLQWRKVKRFFTACATDFVPSFAQHTVRRLRESRLGSGVDPMEYDDCERAVALLQQAPAPTMPSDLAFRIRHRIGQERIRRQHATWSWRWGNCLSPFAIPAAVGLLSAVMIFGVFVRIFEIPVQANSADVPLQFRTPPRLHRTALMDSYTGIECMKVKILVDENGRVADISILKGKQTPEQVRNLQYLLLFAVFDPATLFGKPTSDTVTLKLRDGYLESISL
jgi:hypothetical protein